MPNLTASTDVPRAAATTALRGEVLVISDNTQLSSETTSTLAAVGYHTFVAGSLQEGIAALTSAPDAVIVDCDGCDAEVARLVRQTKRWLSTPIIMLVSGRGSTARIAALDGGADDCIPKPVAAEELRARIDAILRRLRPAARHPEMRGPTRPDVQYGDLSISYRARRIKKAGQELHLPPKQWRLMEVLSTNPGRLLTHDELITSVWTPVHGSETRSSLKVHIQQLRKALGDDATAPAFIRTVPGVGYRWLRQPPHTAPCDATAAVGAPTTS